ncbi:hypothetical protein DKG74_11490 [Zavarzinia aquatilis]|uniref:Transferrin-binding protein B C-lobe/N-lobe beta-barrel domain-containing protein n=2 Tax=Zavarzinia aquatilis TaxID=2211142 RepID=A0A317EBB4_9PROT|nr:hypothetical protein DKG74_11490 [Zavarzinia aquatilis]
MAAGLVATACNGGGGDGLSGVVPPPPPPPTNSLSAFLPNDGTPVEPGIILSGAPGAEDGVGGARTTALNQAYHEASLAESGSAFTLTLNRRPPSAGPETIARFTGGFTDGTGALAGLAVARTADVSRGGTDFAPGAAILVDGGRTAGLDFMSFGYWAVINTDSDTIVTAAGGAIGAPAADLSAAAGLGSATYRGTTVGAMVDNTDAGNLRLINGDIVLSADFATNRLSATISDTRLADPDTGADLGAGPGFVFSNATIRDAGGAASPGFQGTNSDGTFTASMNGAPLLPAGGSFADLAGAFYGPALQEVGGGWYVVTPTEEISGSFGAAR